MNLKHCCHDDLIDGLESKHVDMSALQRLFMRGIPWRDSGRGALLPRQVISSESQGNYRGQCERRARLD